MIYLASHMVGDDDGEVPPVPIPNTAVKPLHVDNTWLATAWEDRSPPDSNLQALSYDRVCFFAD